ncbi:MAG TPA: DedA family protein [Gemmatimonadaceae bacterium]|nr:DedA family protein [Gemmatimonadaceae bacterium]
MGGLLQELFGWLTSLPPLALYAALAVSAATENVFPPLPADTIVAFGAFLAAHGEASLAGAFLVTWVGNVTGALLMYSLGRRFGAEWLARKFPALSTEGQAGQRISRLYERWGVPALFVSRFLPAARALVPPVAGALRVRPLTAILAIALASGLWYGAIAVLAYRIGERWSDLAATIGSAGRWVGIAAVGVTAVVAIVVLVRRRRRA